jgi:hypothetical protein
METTDSTIARLEFTDVQTDIQFGQEEIELLFDLLLTGDEEVEVEAVTPTRFIASFTNISSNKLANRFNNRLLISRNDRDDAWNMWGFICAQALECGSSEIHLDIPKSTVVFYEDNMPGFARIIVTSMFEGVDFEMEDVSVRHSEDRESCVIQDHALVSIATNETVLEFDDDSAMNKYEFGSIVYHRTYVISVYRNGILQAVVRDENFAIDHAQRM